MSDIVLKVENISKQYRLGLIGTGSLSQDLQRWWSIYRGKGDPFEKIGKENIVGKNEFVWALKDVSFDVKQGDVLGIVGKNGAGKSTLLKILSQITSPTSGSVKVKGRIAALLEVGTGFHPELTGMENIYLNGSILGMSKKEINSKLEEIIDFSGVEKYINTPVKRYSSGMLVRLGFAVAAHLEPEILIVDEVLAVGDAEFQKKCLGKMKEVSNNQGRTVLFVSHNLPAVLSLCNKGVLIQNGQLVAIGKSNEIVDQYLRLNSGGLKPSISFNDIVSAPGNEFIKIKSVRIFPDDLTIDNEIKLEFEFWNMSPYQKLKVGFDLINIHEQTVFGSATDVNVDKNNSIKALCTIPANLLNDDIYRVFLYITNEDMKQLLYPFEVISFEVKDTKRDYAYFGKINGIIRPILKWQVASYDAN